MLYDDLSDYDRKSSIYKLCEKEITSQNQEILKELMYPYKDGSIGIVQLNPIVGDLEFNARKIVKYINHAQFIGLDLVVFPELSLLGFPMEDTIGRHSILAGENIKWLKEIAKITTDTTALVGFLEPCNGEDNNVEYYNSVAVLSNGRISSIIRKSFISSDSEFNDYRYIRKSTVSGCQSPETLCNLSSFNNDFPKLLEVNGYKYGVLIGEDCLNSAAISPVDELSKEKPDAFICCSALPARAVNELLKANLLSFISNKYKTPVVSVNQVGANDDVSFEGASITFDASGTVLACTKSFEEQFIVVNPFKNLGKIYSLPDRQDYDKPKTANFTLDYEYDLERTYKTIIQGIRDYFTKTGFKRAVLGLSGGLDSTVCAVLLADALGAENVFGISMPSKITSNESKSDAEQLARNLGINFAVAPIKAIFDTTSGCFDELFKYVENKWGGRYKNSYTPDNIQARARAMFLWGVSNEFGSCLPIATSDKSEAYVGYATINGDMSGGFAPIADVTKTKLFALARWLNKNRDVKNAIPESIILKKPGAELAIDPKTGKPLVAEDALMPYEFLDEIIWRIENNRENYSDMINSKFFYEIKHDISIAQKTEWLDKFYRRMSSALYKWSILPPKVVVDSYHYNYKQPITSSKINYKGTDSGEIYSKLCSWIS